MIRVLMVEDDAAQVELSRALSAQQKLLFALDVVENGESALAFLRGEAPFTSRDRPDLVLVDLNLPGMSGRELLRVLAEDPALSTIPAVAMSAVEPARALQVELGHHARTWVEKPIELAGWGKIIKAVPNLGLCLIKVPEEAKAGA